MKQTTCLFSWKIFIFPPLFFTMQHSFIHAVARLIFSLPYLIANSLADFSQLLVVTLHQGFLTGSKFDPPRE